MSLAALEHDKADDFSARRLLVGYASAAVVLLGVLVLGVVFGKEIERRTVDEGSPVVFAPPRPPPPPVATAKPEAPKPAPKAKSGSPPPLGRPESLAPKAIPHDAPKEGDPRAAVAEAPGVAGGSLDGVVGGTGQGSVAPPPRATTTAPPAPPPAPMSQSIEAIVPPRALAQAPPAFPEEARRAGVQVVVTVKYTVLEDGSVADVVVVKGHPLLDAEVVRAVSRWRFSPATLEGRPLRVTRFAKVPFRPRT